MNETAFEPTPRQGLTSISINRQIAA